MQPKMLRNQLSYIVMMKSQQKPWKFWQHVSRLDYYIVFHPYRCIRSGKVEESAHETIFSSGTQIGKTGFETFQERFEASNKIFWDKTWSLQNHTFSCCFTQRYFQRCKNHVNQSLYAKFIPLRSWPSSLHTYSSGGCRESPHYSWKR